MKPPVVALVDSVQGHADGGNGIFVRLVVGGPVEGRDLIDEAVRRARSSAGSEQQSIRVWPDPDNRSPVRFLG